jgi:hypothetical protein
MTTQEFWYVIPWHDAVESLHTLPESYNIHGDLVKMLWLTQLLA